MATRQNKIRAAIAACLSLGMIACAPTQKVATRVDTRLDCRAVCTRFADCYDNTYRIGSCEQRCDQEARASGDFRRKADACNECMNQHACMETSTACANDCRPVVPLPAPATSSR